MNRRWRRKHMREPSEMNITAFMNLMVILGAFSSDNSGLFPYDHIASRFT